MRSLFTKFGLSKSDYDDDRNTITETLGLESASILKKKLRSNQSLSIHQDIINGSESTEHMSIARLSRQSPYEDEASGTLLLRTRTVSKRNTRLSADSNGNNSFIQQRNLELSRFDDVSRATEMLENEEVNLAPCTSQVVVYENITQEVTK